MSADTRYRPNTRVVMRDVPFKSLVLKSDPEFEEKKRKETFYEFSDGRIFTGNPENHGAYKS